MDLQRARRSAPEDGRVTIRTRLLALALAGVAAAGLSLTGDAAGAPVDQPRTSSRLVDQRPCADIERATCGYLEVPLDRGGSVPDVLRLRVALDDNRDAPRGVLLVLAGGPGQPGLPYLAAMRESLAGAVPDYRLVMLDQRGTGGTALRCPALQQEVGSSDVRVASAAAVAGCAAALGNRRNFYTSADTVADLEALRRALGVPSWTVDGVSYGSHVAQRYALTHPRRVRALVLDSVVPQQGPDPLYTAALRGAGRVLRTACREQGCPSDPAHDLAVAVDRSGHAVELFDALVVLSIIDPTMSDPRFAVLDRLRTAANGDPGPLTALVEAINAPDGAPPEVFSAGLHLATVCADMTHTPWGDSSAPLAGRDLAVRRAVAHLPGSATWPFPTAIAGAHGLLANCRHWPPSRPAPPPPHRRLGMPVLLLAGDRDLSTPVDWARDQAAVTPRGSLVVIPDAGHSVQRRSPAGVRAAVRFLLR
jgi:pimeloyl-ACP methyl ester carboxylesterase